MFSPAFAQDLAADSAAPSALSGLAPLLFIFVVFYFFIIRPQSKKYKTHQAMLSAIVKGDKVVTSGGIHGKVVKVNDDETLKISIATDVDVVVSKAMVAQVESKSKPANDTDKKEKQSSASSSEKKKKA